MLKTIYELFTERNPQDNTSPSREVLERIKQHIIEARSRTNQTIGDLVIEDIKRRHKEWLESGALDTTQIDPNYNVLITDGSIESPFMVSSQLIRIIRTTTRSFQSKESRARAIYDWIEKNIEYGKIGKRNSYINSDEVLNYRRGICAEMAFLYIAMARSIGLKANFVSVDIDFSGKRVHHACAVVETERGPVFVDPAYHRYDVRHKEYHIWKDKEIIKAFGELKGGR